MLLGLADERRLNDPHGASPPLRSVVVIGGVHMSTDSNEHQLSEIDDRRKNPDRRRSPRKKILKIGRTYWPNKDSSECVVFNLSDTGAQLELNGPVPQVFDLVIEGESWRRSCAVVWRGKNRVGVRFQGLGTAEKAAGNSKLSRYIDACKRMATRAEPPDRDMLLEMADAWARVARQLRRRVSSERG